MSLVQTCSVVVAAVSLEDRRSLRLLLHRHCLSLRPAVAAAAAAPAKALPQALSTSVTQVVARTSRALAYSALEEEVEVEEEEEGTEVSRRVLTCLVAEGVETCQAMERRLARCQRHLRRQPRRQLRLQLCPQTRPRMARLLPARQHRAHLMHP